MQIPEEGTPDMIDFAAANSYLGTIVIKLPGLQGGLHVTRNRGFASEVTGDFYSVTSGDDLQEREKLRVCQP